MFDLLYFFCLRGKTGIQHNALLLHIFCCYKKSSARYRDKLRVKLEQYCIFILFKSDNGLNVMQT